MRLVTKTIWRAFPELDRFSDEKCARFVRAARVGRPLLQRLTWWAGQALAVAPIVWLTLWGFAWLGEWGLSYQRSLSQMYTAITLQGVCILALAAVGLLLWIAVGHVFLRRRITFILRARGRCAQCGYGLAGLPVDATSHVYCPECGLEGLVDASMGELSDGGVAGAGRYTPSEEVMRKSVPWLTPARLWKWTKRAALAVLLVLIGLGLAWGVYEWRLAAQAKRAAASKPGAAGLLAIAQRLQPLSASPDAVNGFDQLAPLLRKMNQVQIEAFPLGPPVIEGVSTYFDPTMVAPRRYAYTEEHYAQEYAANAPHNEALFRAMERAGVFDDMRAMTKAPVQVASYDLDRSLPLFSTMFADYSKMRHLARWNAARMRIAIRDDQPEKFAGALDDTLGLSRMLEMQPLLLARLVAVAIEALAYYELRVAIAEHPTAKWLDAIDAVLKKRSGHEPRSIVFDGERVLGTDTVCWVFADTSRTRLGRYNPNLKPLFGGGSLPQGRLGWLDENLRELNAQYDTLREESQLQRWERPVRAPFASDLMLMPFAGQFQNQWFNSEDQEEIDRVATPLLLAIERYKVVNGRYPAALADLVPGQLAALPIDPWGGKPFGYKLLDASKDEQHRGFLLYTFGRDGTDDGGVGSKPPWDALHGLGTPSDYIINDANR